MSGRGAGYVVAQFVLMLAAVLAPVVGVRQASWPLGVVVVGGALAVVGVGVAAVASVSLGRRSLSPFPKPKAGAVLVQRGVFAVVRHPIYTGLTLFVLGWGLVWSSIATLVGALVLLVFFDLKARREERWLTEEFAGYGEYRQRVSKLIPFLY